MNGSCAWAPQVPLREVLTRNESTTDIVADAQYREVTVKLWGKGVVERRTALGSEISAERRSVVRANQFILSRIDARNGATGIVPVELDGAVVSNDFPTFDAVPNKLLPEYLGWLSKTSAFIDACKRASEGTTNRVRLKEDSFLLQSIPLPPLDEQRRIVDKIERLLSLAEEVEGLQASVVTTVAALPKSILQELCSEHPARGRLSDVLVDTPRNGWSAKCDGNTQGTAVLSLSAVTGYFYNSSAVKFTSLPTIEGAHYWLAPGDLLITRSNSLELVGHAAIYDGQPAPCIYPDLMMRLVVNRELVCPEFVWCWLQTPIVRDFISCRASGTSPSMKKISQKVVQAIPFPVGISLSAQEQIVDRYKQAAHPCLEAVNESRKSREKLSALRRSILDRAFRGDL